MTGATDEPVSADLRRLLRWEEAGATWQVVALRGHDVTLSLLRCDGGEEMERLVSSSPDLVAHVRRTLTGDGPAH